MLLRGFWCDVISNVHARNNDKIEDQNDRC
jgi:hypothetical protein